ncbi:MAG TPA: hypothetical protein VNJ12_01190 [Candidatus Dormibacteraeota bacterium]|nr:hypothetical protein [Candidatus Dormibacteraeota bacterium]
MSQFIDMSWFALIISVVLGLLSRNTVAGRIKYAALSFVAFMAVSIAIAWLMFPFSR